MKILEEQFKQILYSRVLNLKEDLNHTLKIMNSEYIINNIYIDFDKTEAVIKLNIENKNENKLDLNLGE